MNKPQAIMERRRRDEEVKLAEQKRLEQMSKVSGYAQWENDTDARIAQARTDKAFAALKQKEDEKLYDRKRRLADMYNREMSEWKAMVEGSKETTEMVKSRIRNKAEALRAKRMAADRAFVADARQRQWRNSCDDLRQLDTEKTVKEVTMLRAEQLKARDVAQAREAAEELEWDKAWDIDRQQKEQREERDLMSQRKRNTDMKRDLDIQVRAAVQTKQALEEVARQEADATKARWNAEEEAQQQHERGLREAMRQQGREVLLYNNERQKIRGEKARDEMEQDLVLLQVALEKERRELEDEEEKKRAEKEATKQYQHLLRLQMVKEKQDDSLLEELRRRDTEREMAKRDAQHERENKARLELQAAVMQGRAEQEEYRRVQAIAEKKADKVYIAQLQKQSDDLNRADDDLKAYQKKCRIENQQGVQAQMAARRMLDQREQQSIFLENKQMQYYEKQYQKKLRAVRASYGV